ncbi:hypothetical protein ACO0LC_09605 [Undibacterium sp. JH2W]|uniref:hypothetical protein n=1 Tax=Undibacterium sp. JH2W TaxID=3413037 RepID=UPI003BEF6AD8
MPNKPSLTTPPANDPSLDNLGHPAIPFPSSANPPVQTEPVVEKTAEIMQPASEKLTALRAQAGSKLRSETDQAIRKLGAHSEKLYVSQAKLLDNCHSQLRKQPMIFLGLAVATAVAVSVLLHRQMR